MKKTKHITLAAIAIFTAMAATTQASIIQDGIGGDPVAGGIGYRIRVQMGAEDSAVLTSHVGAWSWNNGGTVESPAGWTHTSNFIALNLTEATVFTVKMERKEGVPWPETNAPDRVASTDAMFPSFTLWSGWDDVTTAPENHIYNPIGDVAWSNILDYVGHVQNSTLTTVEYSWTLAPGNYTLALGSNAPQNISNRQGYEATFTTTAVPEPSTFALIAGGLGALALIRRRKSA